MLLVRCLCKNKYLQVFPLVVLSGNLLGRLSHDNKV